MYLGESGRVRFELDLFFVPFNDDVFVDDVKVLEVLDENMECFIVFRNVFTSE